MRNELQRGGSAVFYLQPFGHPTAGATLPLGEGETIPRIAQRKACGMATLRDALAFA
ncbi:MAG: hypothetical protein V7K92_02440 [Nostoc sp.]